MSSVIGNKHVLLAAIRHPFLKVPHPALLLQTFMDNWEREKTTAEYKKRVEISKERTSQREALKAAAHKARRKYAHGFRLDNDIAKKRRLWKDLGDTERAVLDEYAALKLDKDQKKCDEAYGWNQQMKSAAGSAASRLSYCDVA